LEVEKSDGYSGLIFCKIRSSKSSKHILRLREGSSENARVATDLLNDPVKRVIKPDRLRLFVIDESKALRCAIDAVYGSKNSVQRCPNHKVRNVLGHLADEQKDQVKNRRPPAWNESLPPTGLFDNLFLASSTPSASGFGVELGCIAHYNPTQRKHPSKCRLPPVRETQ